MAHPLHPFGRRALGALLLALAACGTGQVQQEGTLVVEPDGTTELVITGMERTELHLDGRGGGPVQMDADDGQRETFGHDTSWRKVFTGTLTLTFRNGTQEQARIHYRASSPGAITVKRTATAPTR